MRIIEYAKVGNPADVLKMRELPSRPPGPGEVRVKVLATPIHPANLLQISGQYGDVPQLPATPGAEGVGEVMEIGPDIEKIILGQKVFLTGVGGTWRDEVTAPAASFLPAPPGELEQLSMMTVNPMTAHLLLTKFAELREGDWIIQSAANSAVGEMIIQLAALRGIKTVNVVRRDYHIANLRSLGGTAAFTDSPDLPARVRETTDGTGARVAFDCVGGETFEHLMQSLGPQGTMVSYGTLSGESPRLDLNALNTSDLSIRSFWLLRWYREALQSEQQETFGALVPLVASGQIKTKIDSRFPLEEIGEAVIRAAESGRDGKVILTPHDD